MDQKNAERLNKEILENIIKTVTPQSFISFYLTHNQKETCKAYGLRTTKQLTKVLKIFNYDFSKPKPSLYKNKPAVRTHESYVLAGKKSSETQKSHWNEKTEEEKQAWKAKQSAAHNTSEFREKIRQINIEYWNSLNPERKKKMNEARSISAKDYWNSLSAEEQEKLKNNRLQSGKTYSQRQSGPNERFAKKLELLNIAYDREYCLDRKLFDFKVNNCLIEIDPTFTHNSTFTPFEYGKPLDKYYHASKTELANHYGMRCIHIFDWDDEDKIIALLNNNRNIIYARQCSVQELAKDTAKAFINKYHLQKDAKASIRLGLYHKNELVSVMTFGKPRYNKSYDYELIRYCASANIIGGSEKLLAYFLKAYKCKSIISYCDLSKFSGKTYERLGFKIIRKGSPSKHWYNPKTKEHYTDNLIRQHGFSQIINSRSAKDDLQETTDNRTLMLANGFVEIYDCGQRTYSLILE